MYENMSVQVKYPIIISLDHLMEWQIVEIEIFPQCIMTAKVQL